MFLLFALLSLSGSGVWCYPHVADKDGVGEVWLLPCLELSMSLCAFRDQDLYYLLSNASALRMAGEIEENWIDALSLENRFMCKNGGYPARNEMEGSHEDRCGRRHNNQSKRRNRGRDDTGPNGTKKQVMIRHKSRDAGGTLRGEA